jgi:DNA-binding winged helix-turn-helix (wHTH) protein/TolB-like protein
MIHRFGVFEFDDAALELRKAGRPVPLEPQPARALALLLSRPGELVDREALRRHLWGDDVHVDFDRGLAYCVGELRRALGDQAESPSFIQTLPRRGYRFLAPVAAPEATERDAAGPAAPLLRPGARLWLALVALALVAAAVVWMLTARTDRPAARPIVAVSAFDNETGDPRYDRPVRAIGAAVVDRLTALGPQRVGVVANATELRLPRSEPDLQAIARSTGADYVLLGDLQDRGGGLSLFLQFIALDDGTHFWVERLPRPAGDALIGLDEETASAVAAAVEQHVLARPGP